MIIEVSGKVYSFEYSKIKRIYKKYCKGFRLGFDCYLYIITDIGNFNTLAYTNLITYEDFIDITDYLLKKIQIYKLVNQENNIVNGGDRF